MQKKQKASKRRRVAIDINISAWRLTGKLSLSETGELVRALKRASSLKRPNREQRMLLAVFTREPDGEVAS